MAVAVQIDRGDNVRVGRRGLLIFHVSPQQDLAHQAKPAMLRMASLHKASGSTFHQVHACLGFCLCLLKSIFCGDTLLFRYHASALHHDCTLLHIGRPSQCLLWELILTMASTPSPEPTSWTPPEGKCDKCGAPSSWADEYVIF